MPLSPNEVNEFSDLIWKRFDQVIIKEKQMSDLKEKIKVMEAYLEGKEIQQRVRASVEGWREVDHVPEWNWGLSEFRVKPEPLVLPSRVIEIVIWHHLDENRMIYRDPDDKPFGDRWVRRGSVFHHLSREEIDV